MASASPQFFDCRRILYCSKGGLLCGMPDFCYRCNLDQRVEPIQLAFANVFERRRYWHAIVVDYEIDADHAGLWTGTRGDRHSVYLPHRGKPDGHHFLCYETLTWRLQTLCKVLLRVADVLKDIGAIDGYLAVIEPHLSFWPASLRASRLHSWADIDHALLPHVHLLVWGDHPLTEKLMVAVYDMLQAFLLGSYANIWFEPVKSQTKLSGWLNYIIKPWPITDWYRQALYAGCDPINLSYLFDDIALLSCSRLFPFVFSPRLAGVLHPNIGSKRYILDRVPRCLGAQDMVRCKDEQFYREHEEGFWRTEEKRSLRMGRQFRCRAMDHQAALRRIAAWSKARRSTVPRVTARPPGFLAANVVEKSMAAQSVRWRCQNSIRERPDDKELRCSLLTAILINGQCRHLCLWMSMVALTIYTALLRDQSPGHGGQVSMRVVNSQAQGRGVQGSHQRAASLLQPANRSNQRLA
jgi:hypothetical protein